MPRVQGKRNKTSREGGVWELYDTKEKGIRREEREEGLKDLYGTMVKGNEAREGINALQKWSIEKGVKLRGCVGRNGVVLIEGMMAKGDNVKGIKGEGK